MRKTSRIFAAIAFAIAVAVSCSAATNQWDGTWKVNQEKSKFNVVTVTITDMGNGMYQMDTGSFKYKFSCDGKQYAMMADRMGTCTMKEKGKTWDTVTMANGTTLGTGHHEVSADGKTMTVTNNGTRADGTTYTLTETYMRTGSGMGMVGKWKEKKEMNSNPAPMVLKVNGDMLHREFPQSKSYSDSKLDGTVTSANGPQVPKGVTMSTKSMGANKLHLTMMLDGKAYNEQMWTLSSDGKMITIVSWSPDKPNEKETTVYDKMM
jgi:hypothetical protein